MSQKLTDQACKNIIKRLGTDLGVDPKLITTRLMDEDDKNNMRNGELPLEVLELHIKCWMKAGMPNYREGKTIPMSRDELAKKAPSES